MNQLPCHVRCCRCSMTQLPCHVRCCRCSMTQLDWAPTGPCCRCKTCICYHDNKAWHPQFHATAGRLVPCSVAHLTFTPTRLLSSLELPLFTDTFMYGLQG